jgi:two-component system, response regulator
MVRNRDEVMSPTVLFVEDDADDVFLIQRACKSAQHDDPKEYLPNGKAAVDYLSQTVAQGRSLPRLIFLDLNMPLMGGLEFLSWLRNQPLLRNIPVVVLTTSVNPQDLATAYRSGANAYLVKPSSISELDLMAYQKS